MNTRNDPECGMSGFVIPDDDAPPTDLAIINHMARALRDVIDLSLPESRVFHYVKANVSNEQIAEFDRRAVILEEARRATLPKERPSMRSIVVQIAGTTSLLAFGMFCTGLASTFPEPAQAAYLTPKGVEAYSRLLDQAAMWGKLFAVGLVIALFLGGAALLIRGLSRLHVGPFVPQADDWSEPYGAEPTRNPEQKLREGGWL